MSEIIKTIALTSALAACPIPPGQPALRAQVEAAAPAHHPELPAEPEQHHHQHPADDDPSPMYRGLVSNTTNTASRIIIMDSGASASRAPNWGQMWPGKMWLEGNVLIGAIDVEIEELLPAPPNLFGMNLTVSPNASKHLANKSTTKIRESVTRRLR